MAVSEVKSLGIKTEATQQQNEAKFEALMKTQLEVKNLVNSVQATLIDLSAQSNSSQTTVKTIQDGMVANTINFFSDSEITKQNFVKIEQRFEMLNEQIKENSLPPTQPEPIVQTLAKENKENVGLEDSSSLSLVQKRQSKGSQTMEIAQSTEVIETQSPENLVSIVSDPDSQVARRKSTNLKVKKLKQRKHKLRKKNKMKAIEKDDDLEIKDSIEEANHEEDSSSTVKFLIKTFLNFSSLSSLPTSTS